MNKIWLLLELFKAKKETFIINSEFDNKKHKIASFCLHWLTYKIFSSFSTSIWSHFVVWTGAFCHFVALHCFALFLYILIIIRCKSLFLVSFVWRKKNEEKKQKKIVFVLKKISVSFLFCKDEKKVEMRQERLLPVN